MNFNQWFFRGFENYAWESGINTRIFWQPINALSLNLQPSINWNRNDLQYIQTSTFGGEDRFLLGRIDQATYRISLRSTFNLTPNFSVELWAQPFMTRGEYSEFKLAVLPHAESYEDRFFTLTPDQLAWEESESAYSIDENRDGISDYTMDDPDFNVVQFRSNVEGAYRFDNRARAGVAFYHLSNASLGNDNPGTEVLSVFYAHPIKSIFGD